MAASTVLQLLVLAVSGLFFHHVQVVSGLHVEIFPTVINELINDAVSVKCLLNDSPFWTARLLVIELGKKDEHPLAILRNTELQQGAGLKHNMIADGNIDEVNITQSFLRIKITNPELKDAGIYVCRMFYMDAYGDLKEGKAGANLTFNNNNDKVVLAHLLKKMSDVEKTADTQGQLLKQQEKELKNQQDSTKVLQNTVAQQKKELKNQQDNTKVLENTVAQQKKELKNQQDNTNVLENTVAQQKKELKDQQDKTNALEKTVARQEKQLEDQRTNETVTIAFNYAYDSNDKLVQGQPMLFTDKIMSIGDAYDPKSGVFTAPRDGLYVFHLVVGTYANNDEIEIHLEANGKWFASLYVRDLNDDDQASVSSVTSLKAEDQVMPLLYSISTKENSAWGNRFSTFSGYLQKLL